MANELSLSLSFSCSNSGYSRTANVSAQYNQNTVGTAGGITNIATGNGTALTFSPVATFGWLFLQNLDSTNYLDYGIDNAGVLTPFGRLKPGESALLRLTPGISFRAAAHTAACNLHWWCLND